jgi:hypothetical protein
MIAWVGAKAGWPAIFPPAMIYEGENTRWVESLRFRNMTEPVNISYKPMLAMYVLQAEFRTKNYPPTL